MTDSNFPEKPGRRAGAPKGNRNAFKHGRYTAAECAQRRRYTALKRRANALIEEVEVLICARRQAAREAAEAAANAMQAQTETQGEGGPESLEQLSFAAAFCALGRDFPEGARMTP